MVSIDFSIPSNLSINGRLILSGIDVVSSGTRLGIGSDFTLIGSDSGNFANIQYVNNISGILTNQILGLSGIVNNFDLSNIVYTYGSQTISGQKNFSNGILFPSGFISGGSQFSGLYISKNISIGTTDQGSMLNLPASTGNTGAVSFGNRWFMFPASNSVFRLQANGGVSPSLDIRASATNATTVRIIADTAQGMGVLDSAGSNGTQIKSNGSLALTARGGLIGIGTSNPSYLLHVFGGDIRGDRNIFIGSGIYYANTGDYTLSGTASIAQLIGLSGILDNTTGNYISRIDPGNVSGNLGIRLSGSNIFDIQGITGGTAISCSLINTTITAIPNNSTQLIIGATDGRLLDSSGSNSINWNNRIAYDISGNYSIDYQSRQLSSSNFITIDWGMGRLYDPNSFTNTVDWSALTLNSTAGGVRIDWGNYQLQAGPTTLNWNTKTLTGPWAMAGNTTGTTSTLVNFGRLQLTSGILTTGISQCVQTGNSRSYTGLVNIGSNYQSVSFIPPFPGIPAVCANIGLTTGSNGYYVWISGVTTSGYNAMFSSTTTEFVTLNTIAQYKA